MTAGRSAHLRLREFLPYRLSVLSNRVSGLIADAYTRRFGIGIPQWRVIAVLGESPGLTSTQVAEWTAMDKVAVTRAVQGLVAMSLVQRRASQKDGRVTHLVLSRAGRAVYAEIAPLALDYEREIAASLTATERARLTRILDKLAEQVARLESEADAPAS